MKVSENPIFRTAGRYSKKRSRHMRSVLAQWGGMPSRWTVRRFDTRLAVTFTANEGA